VSENLLNITKIKNYISPKYYNYLENNKIIILDTIDSTNSYLLNHAIDNNTLICLAETQTNGRGRLERTWFSPPNNIYLSLLWHFNHNINQLSNLSIEVAVAVNRILRKLGVIDSTIKWPNDILWHNRKLAGILIETRVNTNNNTCYAVIGVGLNVNLSKNLLLNANITIEQIVDLTEIMQSTPERNKLAGMLIEAILTTVLNYD
jgi:BirA family transcriptional regulator, biotin operon repressor / biotin---[acetyl-CoA-carboxylase] ligase